MKCAIITQRKLNCRMCTNTATASIAICGTGAVGNYIRHRTHQRVRTRSVRTLADDILCWGGWRGRQQAHCRCPVTHQQIATMSRYRLIGWKKPSEHYRSSCGARSNVLFAYGSSTTIFADLNPQNYLGFFFFFFLDFSDFCRFSVFFGFLSYENFINKKKFKHWIAQYIPPKIVGFLLIFFWFFGFFWFFWFLQI